MLTAAVLVPDTALLVPGAAGAAHVLVDERAAAVEATAVLAGVDRILVVPVGDGPPSDAASAAPGLAGAGIDERFLAWSTSRTRPEWGVAASIGLMLLSQTGWSGTTEVVPAGSRAAAAHDVGATAARAADRVGLLLLGTMSARREIGAPLPPDPRAATVDDAVLADLADLDPRAVDRLAAVPSDLADDLVMTAWAPWQVLVGAVRATTGQASTTVHHVTPGPVRYAVMSWRW